MTQIVQQQTSPSDGAYITVNGDLQITCCSQPAARLIGKPASAYLIGKNIQTILSSSDREREIFSRLEQLIKDNTNNSVEFSIEHYVSGTYSPLRVQIVILRDSHETLLGAVVNFPDFRTPLVANRLALHSIAEGVFTVDCEKNNLV